MVYENTHLWAAEKIRSRIGNSGIADILAAHVEHYHLGAVFPDVLYFHKNPKVRDSAKFLHGEAGAPTNIFIFEVLDHIRGTRDAANLSFVCGFLTHCAMDIVFHPVVFYFSGYDPQGGPGEQAQSSYLHWHYETLIDRHFNNGIFLERLVNPDIVNELKLPPIKDISRQNITEALKRQIFYFQRIHSRFYYLVFGLLAKLGLMDKLLVAGFYANLDREKKKLPEKLSYRDLFSGKDREATLDGLMAQAIHLAVRLIEAADDYFSGRIGKTACEAVIAGNNLDTGEVNRTTADIRFSIKS